MTTTLSNIFTRPLRATCTHTYWA